MDDFAIKEWIRSHVVPAGEIETAHERPWSRVWRVPLAEGVAWFKACATVQAFEPRLTAKLSERWTERVTEVLAHNEERAWLLTADAGQPLSAYGNPPERWLEVLPAYAELQRGEASHADDHLSHGVPDQRIATLPARYDDLLRRDLPLESEEIRRLRGFAARLARLCEELDARGVPETVQHDDLHMNNVYLGGDRLRVLDWGGAPISPGPSISPSESAASLTQPHGSANGTTCIQTRSVGSTPDSRSCFVAQSLRCPADTGDRGDDALVRGSEPRRVVGIIRGLPGRRASRRWADSGLGGRSAEW